MKQGDLVAGRFRIERAIGSGGMGTVFRARDEQTGKIVAVKVMEIRTAMESGRAHTETQALAQLRHPAIVGYIADGVLRDGRLFLAMEWIDGITLAERLADRGVSLPEVVEIARRIASALAAAHDIGVLHRDIKPSNVLLASDRADQAMLIDFGIARVATSNISLTRTGATVGTPGYMSPEQARGERLSAPGIDEFGLGSTLYECVTGGPPFTGATPVAILAKVVFAEVRPACEVDPVVPVALSNLLEGMMKKKLARRVKDCHAVIAALDAMPPIADPRRPKPGAVHTAPTRPTGIVHCMVVASRGIPDDVNEPPTPDQLAQVEQAAGVWHAELEVLETGAVCAHVLGDSRDATHRAACLALALKRVLGGFSIALSAGKPEAGAAADTGTALLTRSVMASVFGAIPSDAIALDPATIAELETKFEISRTGSIPHLVKQR